MFSNFPRWMQVVISICFCITILCTSITIHDKATGTRMVPYKYRLHLTADTSDAKAATIEATKIAH